MSTLTLYTVYCPREDGRVAHTTTTSELAAAEATADQHLRRGCPVRLVEAVHENDVYVLPRQKPERTPLRTILAERDPEHDQTIVLP